MANSTAIDASLIPLLPSVLDLQPKAHLMMGFAVTFLTLVWFSISLRIYVRVFMIRALGWDDGFLLLSAVTFTAFSACLVVIAKFSRSHAVEEAYETLNVLGVLEALDRAMEYVIIYDALYILTTALFKISLAIFFLRIVVISWQRHLIYIATGIYTIYSTVFILIITFRCGTPSDLLINAFKGRCISDAAIMPLVYTSGVLNAAVDWIFAVFPVLILWNSNMPRRAKISAGVLLSMGCLGSIASIIRIPYLGGLSVDSRFFEHAIDAGLLSMIEPGLAITAASFSALRPLFKSMKERSLPTFRPSGYGRTKHSNNSMSDRKTGRSHRAGRSRVSFEDQKGFRVFDNTGSRTNTIIATTPRFGLESDQYSNDGNTLNRVESQGSLVEHHQFELARIWAPPYSGKGVMMTRAVNVTGNDK